MSLTSFLRLKEVQRVFHETFPVPEMRANGHMQAFPQTENYGLVGTAFDYLLRFYVEYLNPDAISKRWVAEIALKQIYPATAGWSHEDAMELVDIAERILVDARTVHTEFLQTGDVTDDLVVGALQLAQLDPIYRGREVKKDIGEVRVGDVQDLYSLLSIVTPANWIAENLCLLNPTFGLGSALVMGADADIVLDSNLIDLKTTKYLTLRPEYYHQLIGYYILWFVAGDRWPGLPPEVLSIYFCRHGVLVQFKTEDLFPTNEHLLTFARWFTQTALKRYYADRQGSEVIGLITQLR